MDTTFFLEQFGHLAQSPNGVKKLRKLILELAIRGRLVPQNPADENATLLIKKIDAKKTLLIEQRIIREQDNHPPIKSDEEPYKLPSGWGWYRFGRITFNRDAERIPLSREDRTLRQGDYDYYGASGVIDTIDDYIFDKPLLLIGEDGANLLARSTPIAFLAHGKYWVNNHAHVIDGYNYDFLRYMEVFINAIDLEKYVTGTAQPKMNQAKMNSIPVALPPLAEQQHIVARVDELMELCDQLEAEQAKRDHLRERATKSTLYHLSNASSKVDARKYWAYTEQHFPELFDCVSTVEDLRAMILQLAVQGRLVPQNPDDEPACELLKLIEAEKNRLVKAGEVKKSKALSPVGADEVPYQLPQGWEWTRLSNIGEINPRNDIEDDLIVSFIPMALISEQYKILPDMEEKVWGEVRKGYTHFAEGDVALAKITPCFQNGKATVMRNLINGFGAGTTELHIFRDTTRELCPDYIYIFLKSPYFVREGIGLMTGTAGQQRVPKDYFALAPIPIPPIAEQHRIVAKVDELMALCDQLAEEIEYSRALSGRLFDSIVYHLFEEHSS